MTWVTALGNDKRACARHDFCGRCRKKRCRDATKALPTGDPMRHLIAVAALAATMPTAQAATCQATSPKNTVALVELYTSQGCSSCPPADRWLSQLPSRIDANRAIPLALHVGYWDYIGWKDPFAKREFNDRQSQLAALNGNRTRYTPGVFVQGRETNWSSRRLRCATACGQSTAGCGNDQARQRRDARRQSRRARSCRACNAQLSQESAFVHRARAKRNLDQGDGRREPRRNAGE